MAQSQMGIRNEYVAEGIYPGLSSCLKVAEPNGHTVVFYHSMKQVKFEMNLGRLKHCRCVIHISLMAYHLLKSII